MSKLKVYLYFSLSFLFLPGITCADTVFLKSGEKIEGRVLREGEKKVLMVLDTPRGLVSTAIAQEEVEHLEKSPQELNSDEAGQEKKQDIAALYKEFVATYRQANEYFQTSQYYDAMESYRRAVELNPKFAEAHYNLGVVYVNLNFSTRAKESFQAASKLIQSLTDLTEKDKELAKSIEKALSDLK